MGKLIAPVVAAGTMAGADQPDVQVDEELALRAWRVEDAAVVVRAFSDPDIQHWHFRRYDSEKKVVGRVTIYTSLEDGYGEVSYWVLPHARRRGIASCGAPLWIRRGGRSSGSEPARRRVA